MSKYLKKRKPNFREYLNLYFYFNLEELKNYIFHSAFLSYIYTAILFIISVLFNGDYVHLPSLSESIILGVLSIFFKAMLITGFYFLLLCAYGNARELNGHALSGKDLTVLGIISLLQAYREISVIIVALSFIVNILNIIRKKQEREEKRLEIQLEELKRQGKILE